MSSRKQQVLASLGVTRWRMRQPAAAAGAAVASDAPAVSPPVGPAAEASPRRATDAAAVAGATPPALEREQPAGAATPMSTGDMIPVDAMGWDALRASVAGCERCALHTTRTNTVFGVGNPAADWLFVGEAPGAQEDAQGEPFVGRAGKLLNAMLRAVGKTRDDVFIANVLKCRPPNNRDPSTAEAAECNPFLRRQIALIEPRVIIALGRVSAQRLLGVDTPLGRLRGKVHEWQTEVGSVPVVVTYHPAYLLRSPGDKRKAWEDLRLVMKVEGS